MMQAAETAGITAMADALVASGSVSRADASRMLAAEIAAADGGAVPGDAYGATPAGAATAADASNAAFARANAAAGTTNAPAGAPSSALRDVNPAPGQGTDRDAEHPGSTLATPANPLAEIEIDPLFAPPDTPDGYHLTLNPSVPMTVADVQAVREWFHTLRLPQPIAQSLYSEVERMSRERPDAAAIDRMNQHTMATLRRAWGERTDTMLGHAQRLIDDAAQVHPGIKAALKQGPGSNPLVVRQLAEHAARLYAPKPGAPQAGATQPKGDQ